jgi:aspartate/methionine/tyrosine aminotransferase
MGETAKETETAEIFLNLLKRAANAHHVYEKQLGQPDPDWPQWYAEHMTRALRDAGYHISRDPPSI